MNQICIECQRKDEKIQELKQRVQELEEEIEQFYPQISQIRELEEHQQQELKDNIQKALANLIGQQPHKQYTVLYIRHTAQTPNYKRSVTGNLTQYSAMPVQFMEEQHTYIGQRFYEHFLIIGPDIEQMQVQGQATEIKVKPKILYQFPQGNQDQYDIIPYYAFPNEIVAKKLEGNSENFNEKVLPELKQIIMQTLQLNKSDQEFVFTIPREDIQDKHQMTVSEFVKESNPNVFRYLICFEINEFICLDPNSNSCWLCPIVHCFVSYYPFIKFFLKENAAIWNNLKLERIEPCLCESTSKEVLQRDFIFMKKQLHTIINRLFELRSIKVIYDQKYKLNDSQIQTPKKESAKFIQYFWGSENTFQVLSFKEVIYLLAHLLLSQRVILFSKSKAVLSQVMLTIVSLIHPFNYQLPFCILLPEDLIDRVAAPCPFFFGITGEYTQYSQRIEEVQQDDITYFDLNTKKVYFSKDQSKDLAKLIPPLKDNAHLRQVYNLINSSKDNAFKNKHRLKSQKSDKNNNQTLMSKKLRKILLKQFIIIGILQFNNIYLLIENSSKMEVKLHLIQLKYLNQCFPNVQETQGNSLKHLYKIQHLLDIQMNYMKQFIHTINDQYIMDVFLIVIICIVSVLLMYVNIYLLALYCHPEDGGFGSSFLCKIIVVLGLTLSWCQTLMLSLDITNARHQYGLDMHLCWMIIYISVFVMLVFLIPVSIFYYETDDEKPFCQRICLTFVQEIMVLIFSFLTIFLTYFWLRDAKIPVFLQIQNADVQFQQSQIDFDITTYTISQESLDSIAVTVDPITFTIGLMCFLGYFFLILYGGIGLVALPLDLVCSFGTRPVFKSSAQATEKKQRLKRIIAQMIVYAKQLRDLEKDLKCSSGWWSRRKQKSSIEKKYTKLFQAVTELEEECEIFQLELNIDNANPLVYIFKLILGIILFLVTLTWWLHLLLYVIITVDGIPFSPWLNKLFIQLEIYNVNFLGVFFFGFYTLYLLWCVTKGNMKFSMPWIFKFHPMKINETWMNSFLFNIVLILISSVALCHFSTSVFSQYARLTTVDLIFGIQIRYLEIFSWAFKNKVFEIGLFSWSIFAGIIQMIMKCRKPRLLDELDKRKKNLKGNYEIELKEMFLKKD